MFLPECVMASRAAGASPYELRSDPEYNPLEAVLEAAVLVGAGAAAVPRQVGLLDAASDVVRYWAAVGLFAARAELGPHVDAVRARLAGQPGFVAIELAAALYAVDRDPEARRILEDRIADGEPLLAHQALEKLLYMPKQAPDFVAHARNVLAGLPPHVPGDDLGYARRSALEMLAYVYGGDPLFYADDVRYLNRPSGLPPSRDA